MLEDIWTVVYQWMIPWAYQPTLSFGFLADVISQRKHGDVTQSCSTLEVRVPKLSSPFFLENECSLLVERTLFCKLKHVIYWITLDITQQHVQRALQYSWWASRKPLGTPTNTHGILPETPKPWVCLALYIQYTTVSHPQWIVWLEKQPKVCIHLRLSLTAKKEAWKLSPNNTS
jgi:hypothetical protein